MLPGGSWSWIAVRAFLTRGITPPGSSREKGRLEIEEKQASARQKMLARELEWVRKGAKARQAKSKARLANYEKMVNQDQKRSRKAGRNFHPTRPAAG